MNILIAAKETGIGNKVQFIPVIEHFLKSGHTVYSDSYLYRYIGMKVHNIFNDRYWSDKIDVIYVPFGYNWKKFLRLMFIYPFIPKFGYKYRIMRRHIGFGYRESHIFNDHDSELYQNVMNFGGVYDYPEYLNNEKVKNSIVIHNTDKHEKAITEKALLDFIKLVSLDGYNPVVVGNMPFSYELGAYYRETPNIFDLIELVRSSEYYIGGDTGVMHLADCFNVKSLVYFGSTDSVKNGSINGLNIQSPLQCSPCYDWGRVECTNSWKYKCVQNISGSTIYHDFMNYENHLILKQNMS